MCKWGIMVLAQKNGEKPKLGIDLDNTLANSDAVFRELLKEHYGINLSREDETGRKEEVTGLSSEKIVQLLREGWATPDRIFPLDKNLTYFLSLLHEIYEIYIVTSNHQAPLEVIEGWLRRNNVQYDQLIITERDEDKTNYVDVLVDDSLECAEPHAKAGKQAVLLAWPYNKNFNKRRIARFETWEEIFNYLQLYYAFVLSKRS